MTYYDMLFIAALVIPPMLPRLVAWALSWEFVK